MRKDLRVGLGIGGVLLAVLLVAMVVKSRTKNPTTAYHASTPNNTDAPPAGGTDNPGNTDETSPPLNSATPGQSGGQATSPPAAPVTPGPATSEPAKPKEPEGGDIFAPGGPKSSDWDTLLKSGPAALAGTSGGNSGGGLTTSTPPERNGTRARPFTPSTIGVGTSIDSGTGTGGTTAPRPAPGTKSKTHTVAVGETFSTIARDYLGSKKYYYLIEKANPGVDPTRLRPNQKIVIPEMPAGGRTTHTGTHTAAGGATGVATHEAPASIDPHREYMVRQNDSLYRISTRLYGDGSKVDDLYNLNKDRIGPDRERLKLGIVLRLPSPPTASR